MATRGAKPKAPELHVVNGTDRPDRHGDPDKVPAADGRPEKLKPPKRFPRKAQRELWETYIEGTPWLTLYDVPNAYLWVMLYEEFLRDPGAFVASKIAQMRALGSDLGLDPASRVRLGANGKGKSNKGKNDHHFDD